MAHLKEKARLYKLQLVEEKPVERERLKEVQEKERAAKEAEKERLKALRDAQKAIHAKRVISRPHKPTSLPQSVRNVLVLVQLV